MSALLVRAACLILLGPCLAGCALNPLLTDEEKALHPYDADHDDLPWWEDCDDGDPKSGIAPTWYPDADGDHFGVEEGAVEACEAPEGYVANATDCDAADPTRFPGASEICGDRLINDCDGPEDIHSAAADCLLVDATSARTLDDAVAQGRALTLQGAEAGDGFGTAVTLARGGAVVGAPGATCAEAGCEPEIGLATLYELRGDSALASLYVWTGGHEGDGVGAVLDPVADLDEDGLPELLVGAPDYQGDSGASSGGAWLLNSASDNAGKVSGAADPWVFEDWDSGDEAGAALAAGDVCGSGETDLIVGAPGAEGVGSVTAFDLAGAVCASVLGADAGGVRDQIGVAVATADVDVDGVEDLISGGTVSVDGDVQAGVWLYLGPLAEGMSAADAEGLYQEVGCGACELRLAAGDLDGDGAGEVVIGIPGVGDGAGEVLRVPGGWTGDAPWTNWVAQVVPFTGETGDEFGTSVAIIGDLDGDDVSDLAIGAPGHDVEDSAGSGGVLEDAGMVWLLSGSGSAARIGRLDGIEAAARVGAAVAGGEDLDGDGWPELIIGAPGAGEGAGEVWLVRGAWY